MKRRLVIGLITGAILGVFCIIGAQSRFDGELSNVYLFSFWFNRFLMGFVIGVLPLCDKLWKVLVRGVILGLFVSFAFYSATEFKDLLGFLVGGVYGLIISFTIFKLGKIKSISN